MKKTMKKIIDFFFFLNNCEKKRENGHATGDRAVAFSEPAAAAIFLREVKKKAVKKVVFGIHFMPFRCPKRLNPI